MEAVTSVCALPLKRCSNRGEIKHVGAFYRYRDGKLNSHCKACHARMQRAWIDRNREKVNANARAWKRANPEKVRAKHIRYLYGIELAEVEALLLAQGGACALCGASEPGGRGAWHVDHDHACCPSNGTPSCGRCVRGLLCHGCNVSLGHYEKLAANPNLPNYLTKPYEGTY